MTDVKSVIPFSKMPHEATLNSATLVYHNFPNVNFDYDQASDRVRFIVGGDTPRCTEDGLAAFSDE